MQHKNICFNVIALTALMSFSTGLASSKDRGLTDVTVGIVVGSAAKLVGNTAFKDGDLSMGTSLGFAAGTMAIGAAAAYKGDNNTNLLIVGISALLTYCGWTKAYPHKKKQATVILFEPERSTHSHSDSPDQKRHRVSAVPSLLEGSRYQYNR